MKALIQGEIFFLKDNPVSPFSIPDKISKGHKGPSLKPQPISCSREVLAFNQPAYSFPETSPSLPVIRQYLSRVVTQQSHPGFWEGCQYPNLRLQLTGLEGSDTAVPCRNTKLCDCVKFFNFIRKNQYSHGCPQS